MAMGINEYNPTLDREARQFNSGLLQQLGSQIQKDLATVQVNSQLRGLSQGLQQVNPESPDFGKQTIGLMSQYPLASQTPLGQAAINQLGAQHKFWQQEQLQRSEPWAYAGQGVAYNRTTGDTKQVFQPPAPRPVQPPRPLIIRDKNGAIVADPITGEAITQFGDPFAPDEPKAVKPERPTFRSEVEYNKLQPYVKGLDAVRGQIVAAGGSPEASHEDLVSRFGERGAKWSQERGYFQSALTEEGKTWKDAEGFVRSFDKRYQVAPVEAVSVAPVGASASQVEAAATLPVGPEVVASIPIMGGADVIAFDTPESFTEAYAKAPVGATLSYKGRKYTKKKP